MHLLTMSIDNSEVIYSVERVNDTQCSTVHEILRDASLNEAILIHSCNAHGKSAPKDVLEVFIKRAGNTLVLFLAGAFGKGNAKSRAEAVLTAVKCKYLPLREMYPEQEYELFVVPTAIGRSVYDKVQAKYLGVQLHAVLCNDDQTDCLVNELDGWSVLPQNANKLIKVLSKRNGTCKIKSFS